MDSQQLELDLGSNFNDVEKFHAKYQLTYDGPVRALPVELEVFRRKFLEEELQEYLDASDELSNLLGANEGIRIPSHGFVRDELNRLLGLQFDALLDLVYVAMGTAQLQGFDWQKGWERVQAANMTKIRALREDDSKRGSLFDVVKPVDFKAPDHTDLVSNNIYR